MRVDWIVALFTFLLLAGWGFAYYSSLSVGERVSKSESVFIAGRKVTDFMQTASSSIPANFTSGSDQENITLWAYINLSAIERNSTRVVAERMSNDSLRCLFSGDRVYWKGNLTTGYNYFFIEYTDLETSLNCNDWDYFPPSGTNQLSLWAAETNVVFSDSRTTEICNRLNTTYSTVKSQIGITYDFNVLLEKSGSEMTCGSVIPITGREVFVYPASGAIFEGGDIKISVRLWQ